MKITTLIEKLNRIYHEFGDYPIDIRADFDKEMITVALWQDFDDKEPYIKAVTMEPFKGSAP